MVEVKSNSRSSVNAATALTGAVLEIDANHVALVRMRTGQQCRVRADMLPGKSAAPKAGETWLFHQPFGSGWMFAVPMYYIGGDQDFTAPVMQNAWSSLGGVYLPVGRIKDSEGWVSLRGRVTGGVAGQSAFTLPLGYLPGGQIPFAVPVGVGTGLVTVSALGLVTPATGSDTSLEQVRFLARG